MAAVPAATEEKDENPAIEATEVRPAVDGEGNRATLSGPPRFELADNPSASLERSDVAQRNYISRETSPSIISQPIEALERSPSSAAGTVSDFTTSALPTQRKAVQGMGAGSGSTRESIGSGSQHETRTPAEIEFERLELEHRKKNIAAEKEHLRRMRELDEEESNIDYRLRSL